MSLDARQTVANAGHLAEEDRIPALEQLGVGEIEPERPRRWAKNAASVICRVRGLEAACRSLRPCGVQTADGQPRERAQRVVDAAHVDVDEHAAEIEEEGVDMCGA